MPIPQVPSPLLQLRAAKTYNARWFSQTGDTNLQTVQRAINAAVADSAAAEAVFVDSSLLPLGAEPVYNAAISLFYENVDPISADRGDANVTLVLGTDAYVQRFNTTLSTNRTVTLPTGHKDAYFTIVRTDAGPFTLSVGGLISLTSAGGWVKVIHDGVAWRVAENSSLSSGGGGGQVSGLSPFISEVETTGSAGTPPFIHLSNPGGSGKTLVVRKLRIWCTTTQVVKIRRTASPVSVSGITADTPARMIEATGGSPVGVLEGATGLGASPPFTRAEAQWQFPILDANVEHIGLVIASTDFPLYIVAGSALEIALDANSASNVVRAHAIWDEI